MSSRSGRKIVVVKKKVVEGGGHHGGSWKVAYADFVTAMMAFFMVMWILGMDDKTKQAIEGYFANPVGYKKGYGAGESPLGTGSSPTNVSRASLRMVVRSTESRTFEQLRENLIAKIAASDSLRKLNAVVEIQITKDGLRVELIEQGAGEIYFASGSARMKAASLLALQLIGKELAPLPNAIVLEGHTDAAQFGNDISYGNWELSADRANAARRVLEGSGVAAVRIREVRGYAATRLRIPDDPTAPANRRISILLPYSDVPDVMSAETVAASLHDSLVESLKQ